MLRPALLALCAGLLCGACKAPSQIVLGFATDLSAPGVIDRVRMRVTNDEGQALLTETWDLPGVRARDFALPGSFNLYVDDGSEPTVHVEVFGDLGNDTMVTRTAGLRFLGESDLFFRMTLVQRCMGMVCPDGNSCIDGACRPDAVAAISLRAYSPGRVQAVECDSGSRLIATDTQEPMPVDGSGYCGVDQWCGEATCYRNRGQGLLWCTGPGSTCRGVDRYEACLVGQCTSSFETCYGPDWRLGRFAGPCDGYARCKAECACDATCIAACDADRPATCAACLDGSNGLTACLAAAEPGCLPPSCMPIPTGGGDSDASTMMSGDGMMSTMPDMGVLPGSDTRFIGGAVYTIGCNDPDPDKCPSDAQPAHQVDIAPFYIDRLEVTQARYDACVTAGGCSLPQAVQPTLAPDLPVVNVSWKQANAFCAWASSAFMTEQGRLPTEAEWEVAAHGVAGSTLPGTLFPWGDNPPPADCSLASFDGCDPIAMRAAGGRPAGASPFGIEDLAGNAEEWVYDWYDAGTYLNDADAGIVVNPMGGPPGTLMERVKRGGHFGNAPEGIHNYLRYSGGEDAFFDYVGFRCVYVPPTPMP